MPQTILFFLLAFFSINCGYSQRNAHASTISASGGYAQDGYGVMTTYGHYISKDNFIGLSIYLSINNNISEEGLYKIPYYIFTIQPGYYFKLLDLGSSRRPISTRVGGGGIFGYEDINKGSNVLSNGARLNARNKFIYGAFITGELEYNITGNDLSALLTLNEHYHVNSDLGNFSLYIGLGLKYYIF